MRFLFSLSKHKYFGLPYEAEQYLISSNGVDIGLFDQVLIFVNGSMNNSGFALSVISFYFNNTDYQIPVAVVGFQGYFSDFLSASNGNIRLTLIILLFLKQGIMLEQSRQPLDCQNSPESLPIQMFIELNMVINTAHWGDRILGESFSAWNKFWVGWVGSSNMIFSSDGTYSLDDIENEHPSFLEA